MAKTGGSFWWTPAVSIMRALLILPAPWCWAPITEEQKLHFTTVLRSNLNLANAQFLHGCIGINLDILARGPIWDLHLDYKCGTRPRHRISAQRARGSQWFPLEDCGGKAG